MSIPNIPVFAPLATIFVAGVTWLGAAVRGQHEVRLQIVTLDGRTQALEGGLREIKETLVRHDEKLDRLIDHLLDRKED